MIRSAKHLGRALLVLVLALSLCVPGVLAAEPGLGNFKDVRTYTEGYFTDIGGQWFEGNVARGYTLGLIDGTGEGKFSPNNVLTLAETIKLAACLHSTYYTGAASFQQSNPWYQVYVNYCLSKGILTSGFSDYYKVATRAEFASIFAGALPSAALPAINTVADNCIPDVKVTDSYGPAVYRLYRAGILTGSDAKGTFNPQSNIHRSEMAAIVTRMADTSQRREITLTAPSTLDAQGIFNKCSPAVFYIEVADESGRAFASGSGVFLSADGLAVTNYHVIDDAASARIMTTDGRIYDVDGVYDYDGNIDLALLQIHGSGFPYLSIGDSRNLSTGATIYTIGSPLGLDNTLSQGLISNASRVLNGMNFIQISAPISHGSSGGALLNDRGELIGITTALFADGQNLNLAVPIHRLEELRVQSLKPLSSASVLTGTLTLSPSSVSVNMGGTATVTVTSSLSKQVEHHFFFDCGDSSIVTCKWGGWTGNSCPLYLTGLTAGTTTVKVSLFTDENVLLDTKTLTVTVAGNACYSGYYPVPDFGSRFGVPLYSRQSINGGCAYFYRGADIPSEAINEYADLLLDAGFYFENSFEDNSGNTVLVFENDRYRLTVMMGTVYLQNMACLDITIVAS